MEDNITFTSMNIGNCEIKNRIVMAPIHLGMANLDGTLSDTQMAYYEERAKGGVGLIIFEMTRINDTNGVTSPLESSIAKDYHIEKLTQLVEKVHKHGTKLFVGLHHPGRQNSVNLNNLCLNGINNILAVDGIPLVRNTSYEETNKNNLISVAPSRYNDDDFYKDRVTELSVEQIKSLVQDFVNSAVRCKKAGVDGVEINATHGYLIQQFLSPYTNQRNDEYNGTINNRLRFLKEIIDGIKNQCGDDFPIIVRLSVDEYYDKVGMMGRGYGLDVGLKYAKEIEKMGIQAIDVSGGTYETINYWIEPTSFECGWNVQTTKAVKDAVNIPIIATNNTRSFKQAETQLRENIQDFISLGRPLIADPYWYQKIKDGKEKEVKRCINCLNCLETTLKGASKNKHGFCAVNPTIGDESRFNNLDKNGDGRTVVVVGGGSAGLASAVLLASRNFKVIVLEKTLVVGGQINYASVPPNKDKIDWITEDLLVEAEKLGVEIKYGVDASAEKVLAHNPYAVIVSTGARATKPEHIKGYELGNVLTVTDILSKKYNFTGKKVAVFGSGLTGIETAHYLMSMGNSIVVVELEDEIAKTAWFQHKMDILPRLYEGDTQFILNTEIMEIKENCVNVRDVNTKQKFVIDADYVVLSLGSESVNELYNELNTKLDNVFVIGDAQKTGNIARATLSAYKIAMKLE